MFGSSPLSAGLLVKRKGGKTAVEGERLQQQQKKKKQREISDSGHDMNMYLRFSPALKTEDSWSDVEEKGGESPLLKKLTVPNTIIFF